MLVAVRRVGNVGPAAMQVLRACLDPDPKQRATADELLAMPYFQGVTQALPVEDLSAYPVGSGGLLRGVRRVCVRGVPR